MTDLIEAVQQRDIAKINILILNRDTLNIRDHDMGNTALIWAVRDGQLDIVKLLINHNADLNIPNKYGLTALIVAADRGHYDIVKLLIDHNADLNKIDISGKTALIWSVYHNHTDITKLLIAHNADLNIKYNGGSNALTTATEKHMTEIVQSLIQSGAQIDTIRFLITIAGHYNHYHYHHPTQLVNYLHRIGATARDINNTQNNKHQIASIAIKLSDIWEQEEDIEIANTIAEDTNNLAVYRLFLCDKDLQESIISTVNFQGGNLQTKIHKLVQVAHNLENNFKICPLAKNGNIMNEAVDIAFKTSQNRVKGAPFVESDVVANKVTTYNYKILAQIVTSILNPKILEEQYDYCSVLKLASTKRQQLQNTNQSTCSSILPPPKSNSTRTPSVFTNLPAHITKEIAGYITHIKPKDLVVMMNIYKELGCPIGTRPYATNDLEKIENPEQREASNNTTTKITNTTTSSSSAVDTYTLFRASSPTEAGL